MKHLKIMGLAAVAVAAMMAFAGTASATILTSPAGTKYEGEIRSSAETSLTLKAGFANITCTESTVAGTPKNFGSATETVSGPIGTLSFGNANHECVLAGSKTVAIVTVISNGNLEIHTQEAKENGNGTLTGSGSKVKIEVPSLGTTCVYGTGTGLDLGTLTGSRNTGTTATMDINAELSREEGGFTCANPAHWEGSYKVTVPDYLDVD
jgi:hypothetical protein